MLHLCTMDMPGAHEGQKKGLDSPTAPELELQMVFVIYYVRAADRTRNLYKSSNCNH